MERVYFDPETKRALIERDDFCEYFEEHLKQIVPDRLVGPIAALMESRKQLRDAERAFGTLNKDKALEWFRKDADAIHEALKDLWSEL